MSEDARSLDCPMCGSDDPSIDLTHPIDGVHECPDPFHAQTATPSTEEDAERVPRRVLSTILAVCPMCAGGDVGPYTDDERPDDDLWWCPACRDTFPAPSPVEVIEADHYDKLLSTLKERTEALERLLANAEHIFDGKPVRDWDETLAEARAALPTEGGGE